MINMLADENVEQGYEEKVCVKCEMGDRVEYATFSIKGVQGPCDQVISENSSP